MEQKREKQVKCIKNIWKRYFILLCFICTLFYGCTQKVGRIKGDIVPDEAFADASVARIDSILGFSYVWKFGRKKFGMMPEMKADLSGKVCIPDRIFLEGKWKIGNNIEKINIYSIEGKEYVYDKDTQNWKSGAKGSFPNPLEQLKLILSFGTFSFIKFERVNKIDCYLFSFKPNIYFLDPTEETKPFGYLWISVTEKLPRRVKVVSEKGIINWEMSLSAFNSFASITVPLKIQKIRIKGIEDRKKEIALIIERFSFLGYEKPEVFIEDNGDVVFAFRSEKLPESLIIDLLREGKVEFYIGTWPRDPIYKLKENPELVCENYGEGAKLFFERGIVTKPIIVVKRILSRSELDTFDLQNDILGKYSIYAYFKTEKSDSIKNIIADNKEEPLVVVVDGVAVSISRVRDTWLVENKIPIVQGLEGEESLPLFAKLRNEPLEKVYAFSWDNKEE